MVKRSIFAIGHCLAVWLNIANWNWQVSCVTCIILLYFVTGCVLDFIYSDDTTINFIECTGSDAITVSSFIGCSVMLIILGISADCR